MRLPTRNNNKNLQTLESARHNATLLFRVAGIPSAELDAELLLAFVLGVSRESLLANPQQTLSWFEQFAFKRLCKKRAARVPLAYLTGTKEFYGHDFTVNKRVMIPRPVTEEMVEKLLLFPFNSLADIGTGSGCIAITVKREKPHTKVFAVDNNRRALRIAKKNAQHHHTAITFIHGNLAEKLSKPVDVIVVNLPYLPNGLAPTPEMTHEPKHALYGGHEGYELVIALVQQIATRKLARKAIFCEIDPQSIQTLEKNFLANYSVKRFADNHFIVLRPRST